MKNIIKTKHHIFVRVTSIVAIVIIAVCSTLAIQGCEKKEKEQTKNIPVNSIAQGYISKYFRNNNFVLKSQQSLDDFIEAFEIKGVNTKSTKYIYNNYLNNSYLLRKRKNTKSTIA